ncbi:D-serine deaminase-like pyridoxal phosphate-dependent protein [Lipingzhangella halophila]|uniref:D-serine deaminase-like pyridoxal phosphate-dependent protein n=1 Tax=Lipingzhangella halophila TaxID=1783352 RepID=A0A7W7RDJ2_9ACTN|nr:alanine racemase [Lipingzhangella halophila]MBB4929995.1 D-serine deaminase-like pyridoxal phosphate-dependent protein [Lipingzhangella halophila]
MTRAQEQYEAATKDIEPPFAIVDLAAFRANAADLTRRANGTPIRVASKSVRCRHLLREVLALPGFAGVMAYTLPEALWLAGGAGDDPLSEDILVAYPTSDTQALARLGADPRAARAVTVMVDDTRQLDLITRAAPDPVHPIKVCIDIDASWQPLGPRSRIGALRSPIRTPAQAAALARAITRRPQLSLDGIMAYEAQIAGVGDAPPGRPLYGQVLRRIQRRSRMELARRRAAIVRAVSGVADLRFVNGGGTGSVHLTARERAVTEVTAGSGLYQPRLFDHYRGFSGSPAALFALPVVRRPSSDSATVLGGGYLASGTADSQRLPQPYLPGGLALTGTEGAGEVQTPLIGPDAGTLDVGDRVWMRHAKAGELCEHFTELHLLGDTPPRVVETVATYRGEGQVFL